MFYFAFQLTPKVQLSPHARVLHKRNGSLSKPSRTLLWDGSLERLKNQISAIEVMSQNNDKDE